MLHPIGGSQFNARYTALVSFEHQSALPRDRTVNTWAFGRVGLVDDFDNIRDMLVDFYDELQGDNASQLVYPNSFTGDYEIKIYNIDDSPPRVPVATYQAELDEEPAGNELPGQAALVLSFQATPISGIPQARRRGRIYVGPFTTQAWIRDVDAAGNSKPTDALIARMSNAGGELLAASNNSATNTWCVWSRVDDAFYPVDNGWCDNRWDTQRRRLPAATTRSTFGVAP